MYQNIQDAGKKAKEKFLTNSLAMPQKASGWIRWFHEGVPDEPEWLRTIMRAIAAIFGHCGECTALSGCYFVDEETKCPQHPLHERCHCTKEDDSAPSVNADCALEKFTKYIFADKYASTGKRKLFEQLGFTAEDSLMLKQEFQRQAAEKYANGEYELGLLDMRGQRMNISIKFPHETKGTVTFVSGWMIHPRGNISCNTPLGG